MKKLIPDSMKKSKNYAEYGIEYFKGKPTKFWDGMLIGIVLGYIPYLWHMYL